MTVSLSALDAERFGIVVAKAPSITAASLSGTLQFCREHAVEMLIARCRCDDLAAAQSIEEAGGRLMDTLVHYASALDRPIAREPGGPVVRPLQRGDTEGVVRVARACFRDYRGHYHADPLLDPRRCDDVYVSWAERSCEDKAAASAVLVAERNGGVAGFLTLQAGADGHEIVLNGVDPDHQRHGLYRALVLAAREQARAEGARRLTVSTQLTNIAVQRIWTRLGFEPRFSQYTFHLWFRRSEQNP
jgi:GNAT superfamily N-acetyltransferase